MEIHIRDRCPTEFDLSMSSQPSTAQQVGRTNEVRPKRLKKRSPQLSSYCASKRALGYPTKTSLGASEVFLSSRYEERKFLRTWPSSRRIHVRRILSSRGRCLGPVICPLQVCSRGCLLVCIRHSPACAHQIQYDFLPSLLWGHRRLVETLGTQSLQGSICFQGQSLMTRIWVDSWQYQRHRSQYQLPPDDFWQSFL